MIKNLCLIGKQDLSNLEQSFTTWIVEICVLWSWRWTNRPPTWPRPPEMGPAQSPPPGFSAVAAAFSSPFSAFSISVPPHLRHFAVKFIVFMPFFSFFSHFSQFPPQNGQCPHWWPPSRSPSWWLVARVQVSAPDCLGAEGSAPQTGNFAFVVALYL